MDGLPEAPPERSIDQRTKKKARRPTEYDPVKGKRIYDDWQQQRGKGALAN
jgi:hypothetical protein